MKIRRIPAVVLAAAACVAVTAAPSGAHAAGGTPHASVGASSKSASYTVLAGNSKYLVYSKQLTFGGKVTFYARTRHGKPQKLLSGSEKKMLNLSVSLVGTTLTADAGATHTGHGVDTTHVHWWTLGTKHSGVIATSLDPFEQWEGSVPGGLLLLHLEQGTNEATYSVETLKGKTSPLDAPFAEHSFPIGSGPTGLVNTGGTLEFAAYGSEKVVTLDAPAKGEYNCGADSAQYALCKDGHDNDNGYATYRFVPLDGSKSVVLKGLPSTSPTPVGAKIAFRRNGKIYFMSADGTRQKSRSAATPVTEAFGGLIAADGSSQISLVAGPKAKPVTLLH